MSGRTKAFKHLAAIRLSLPIKLGAGAGGVLLAGTLVWLLVSWFVGGSRTLEDEVAMLRARPDGLRYANAEHSLEEYQTVANHAGFSKLPKPDREFVNASLRALHAYQDFERALATVSDPKTAHDLQELEKIEAVLKAITIPSEYRLEWSETPAFRRYDDWLMDALGLQRAVKETERAYEEVIHEGRKVIDTADQARLLDRTREVFSRAEKLPNPERDRDKSIPYSKRVTYAMVFRVQPLSALLRQWKDVESRLKPLLSAAGS